MFEHTGWTSGAGRDADRTAHLPDRPVRLPDGAAHRPDRVLPSPSDRATRLPDRPARLPDRVLPPPADRAAHRPDRVLPPPPDRVMRLPDRPAHLPDLAAVDLRTLRVLDDPALVAEVDRVLGRAAELGESWFSDEGAE
ncbi:hypothetical protein ACWDXD_04530 [Streptomyces sp. NPDC003314]